MEIPFPSKPAQSAALNVSYNRISKMKQIKVKIFSSTLIIWSISIAFHLFAQAASISYTCEVVGKYPDPKDEHKYHQCFFLYGSLLYIHNVCPMKTCYNDTLQYCNLQSCSDYVQTTTTPKPPPGPYDCSTKNDKSFPCSTSGYAGDPEDGSYYYNCVKKGNSWESWCYTCSSTQKTCFTATEGCVPCNGTGGKGGGQGGQGVPEGLLTYDCKGYNQLAFPCQKHALSPPKSDAEEFIDMFANPGDHSVYYKCYYRGKQAVAVCTSCNKGEIYDNMKKKCISTKPPAPPPTKPYDCSTRTLQSFPCTKGGYVSDPQDSSVFYECKQNGSKWESRCYACNSQYKTCYSIVHSACIPCDYKGTGGGGGDGTGPSTTTYDCNGYFPTSIPCQQLGNGIHAHPGDTTVYFNCVFKGGKYVAGCKACKKEGKESFNIASKKCEGGHGKKYDCSPYNLKSYPCKKEGYFVHPLDPSIYFHCFRYQGDNNKGGKGGIGIGIGGGLLGVVGLGGGITIGGDSLISAGAGGRLGPIGGGIQIGIGGGGNKGGQIKKGDWLSKCYICNSAKKACFFEDVQQCVNDCEKGGETGSYECDAYKNKVTPTYSCDYFAQKKQRFFGIFGDRSVYFQCTGITGKWFYHCLACAAGSCFVQDSQKCLIGACKDKSGTVSGRVDLEKPTVVKPTTTTTPKPKGKCFSPKYAHKSYDCTKEGHFPHASDRTLYFQCVKEKDGTLTSKCRICNFLKQGCFSKETNSCVLNCGTGVGTYDCAQTYGQVTPEKSCHDYLKQGQKFFGLFYDKTVYFECEKIEDIWYYNCNECPQGQCFDQGSQRCKACGRG